MRLVTIPLIDIHDPGHQSRAIQPVKVKELAASIEKIGLQTPVTVRPFETVRSGMNVDVWRVVTGRHRLAAIRELGWKELECRVFEGDDVQARLWEISENLHRADLTVQERADQIAEWIELTGENLQSSQIETIENKRSDGRGHRPEGGVSAAARELGIGKAQAHRAITLASLPDEIKKEARAAGIDDNQAALLRVAKEPNKNAQAAAVLREKELVESRKANRDTDKLVAERRLAAVKDYLAARLDVTELHDLGEMLAGICDPLSRALMREVA